MSPWIKVANSSIALPSPLTDFPLAHSHLSATLLFFKAPFAFSYPSFGAQCSRLCLPMQETQVRLLGREDPLEEGNGNPLQDSCVGNPVDRGAWGLQSIGSQKSWTRLSDYKPPAISLLTLKFVSISVLLLNLSCCYKVHTCKLSFTFWVPLPWHHEY